jgi:ABC-2 type transport system permease protein
MKSIIKYELSHFYRKWWVYLSLLIIFGFGGIIGLGATIGIGQDVFKNGSYSASLMICFLSLFSIFFTGITVPFVYFREREYNFHLIYHSLPLREEHTKSGKMIIVLVMCLLAILFLVSGFVLGQSLHDTDKLYTAFHGLNYILPFIYFSILNTLFCIAFLSLVATTSRSKMMVYVSGIMLYIFYMFMLIFTGSPLMSKGMPPSENAVFLTSLFDPFGMSAFFNQTSEWSVLERNFKLLLPQGMLLINRIAYLGLTIIFMLLTYYKFDFLKISKDKSSSKISSEFKTHSIPSTQIDKLKPTTISTSFAKHLYGMLSTIKIDLIYCIKSIPFVMLTIGFLFYLSMEMFGDIEKGVRMPQMYASSGLLASTIIDEFNSLCLIAVLFYTNDLYWRSRQSNFHLIESATFTNKVVILISKWFSLILLISFFLVTLILLGLIFQIMYKYTLIDWKAYAGIFVFVGFRMAVIALFALWIQELIPHRMGALVVSALLIGFMATSFGNRLLNHPTVELFMPFAGKYSDMNSYGPYLGYFIIRYGFAFFFTLSLIIITLFFKLQKLSIHRTKLYKLCKNSKFVIYLFWASFRVGAKPKEINQSFKNVPYNKSLSTKQYLFSCTFAILGAVLFAIPLSKKYIPKDKKHEETFNLNYEKKYRSFQQKAQPIITLVNTMIDLYPSENRYIINGDYVIKNKSSEVIDSILINFPKDFDLVEASLGNIKITDPISILGIRMQPGDSLKMHFKMNYQWYAVNGHQSLNAIIDNGSFMRISRYYPQFGYLSDNEIQDEQIRKENNLSALTKDKIYNAPKSSIDDFIQLDMMISTEENQVAIGVGELMSQRKEEDRNYFHYKTNSPIPFRFGLSSANYAIAKDQHRNKKIEVYYHPTHHENVDHLLENIKHTLDYCESNFGPYPFSTIRFAEISGFTRGFAATAYPATIFMTESMIFHANIHADKKQDVINELAGHELSHLWWGNSQIAPDQRDGQALLTETLAMYTELMLSKKMYGEPRMLENVNLYRRMYMEDRGYSKELPLHQMKPDANHLSYYKGLVVMYQLMQTIREEKVNQALRSFLSKHKHPHPRPISSDLLNEFYAIADPIHHPKIDEWFKQIVTYDFEIVKAKFESKNLTLEATASKKIKDDTGKEKVQVFYGSLEIGIYYTLQSPPQIMKVDVKNGKVILNLNLKAKPVKVVLDPRVLYLGNSIIEKKF